MKRACAAAGLLLLAPLSACGPEPPSELRAVFSPGTIVVRTDQSPAAALRLQNTGRGTAILPADVKASEGLRLQRLKGPEPDSAPVGDPVRPVATASAGDDALPRQWAYGQQKVVSLDLPALFPDLAKPGSFRLTWSHPPFRDTAPAEVHVVPPCASIVTRFGEIVIAFHPEDAPNTVLNFVRLVKKGFYDGLAFHRIIPGFMMQGGCPRGDGLGDAGYKIKAELNARKHMAGTVSMARSQDPDSAGSQFFICFAPTQHLDGHYTAFAEVIQGMDAVKKVETVGTAPEGRPTEKVVMEKVTLLDARPEPPK